MRRAFTLLEMIVALVVVGILLALAIPRMDTSRFRADAVAQLVRGAFQTAERSALTRQHDVLVSFDTAGQRLRVVWDADNNGAVSVGERVMWISLETGNAFTAPVAGLDGTTPASITGSSLRAVDGLPTITLHRDGSSNSSVELYIACAASGQSRGRVFRALRLTQSTGRTEWFRWSSSGKWVAASL